MTLSIALLLISFTGANASGIGSSCSDYHDCGSGLYCYDSWSGNVCTSCTDTLWPCIAYNSIDDNVALVTLMVLMILHLISPTQVLGTVVAINWIAEYLKNVYLPLPWA